MTTILQADETGALTLPPSVLMHPTPRQRYRVATEGGHLVVDEEDPAAETFASLDHVAWLEELAVRRKRTVTGVVGVSLQEIFDDIRGERSHKRRLF